MEDPKPPPASFQLCTCIQINCKSSVAVIGKHAKKFAHSSWIVNHDLVDMPDDELANPSPTMRKDLYQAYLLASERHDLEYFKDIVIAHIEGKAIEEANKEAAKAAKEAAKEAKKNKKPRVSSAKVVEDDEDVEMADAAPEPESEGGEDVVSAKPKNKKRKNPDGETEVSMSLQSLYDAGLSTDYLQNSAQPESVKKPRPTIKLNTPKNTNGTSTPKSVKDASATKSSKPKGKKATKDAVETPAPKKPEPTAEEKRATKQVIKTLSPNRKFADFEAERNPLPPPQAPEGSFNP